jgi:RNA polymerase sigma-70 factor, ECF subfamily
MVVPEQQPITVLLRSWRTGDLTAGNDVVERLYPELRRLAARYMQSEHPGHTLQPTALVHELYLKLMTGQPVDWQDRAHFFAFAGRKLRHILVDHARRVRRKPRIQLSIESTAADVPSPSTDVDVLSLHEALDRLATVDSRASSVVELRFFGGLSDAEMAEVLQLSESTIRRDFRFARAWLAAHMITQPDASSSES